MGEGLGVSLISGERWSVPEERGVLLAELGEPERLDCVLVVIEVSTVKDARFLAFPDMSAFRLYATLCC